MLNRRLNLALAFSSALLLAGCASSPEYTDFVEIGNNTYTISASSESTDNGGSVRLPGWRQNLRFAAAWERSMEGMYPGFTRPVLFSYRFYNQDLTTGSLLIEIGGHGNNLNEALYAGQLAANGLVQALLGPDT